MAENTIATADRKEVELVREETREPERYLRPPVDICESKEGLTVIADVPGALKDSIRITVENSVLTIKTDVEKTADKDYARREFEIAPYFRQFELGEAIDKDKIAAEYKNGVLKVALPFAEKEKPRQIQVKVA